MRNVEAVQQMIDWMEENFENNPSLPALSQAVGYSPWYCSCMFHDIVGMTLKSYMTKRRLSRIAEEIRDTDERILDIAVKYGFSSQEALTRVFKTEFACTPAAYRRQKRPIPMTVHKHVLFPNYDEKRIITMEKTRLGVRVEHIPASDYLVFSYPCFDFMSENAEVMYAVEELAFGYDPSEKGYRWNEESCPIYQRHCPEKFGYEIVRPVR